MLGIETGQADMPATLSIDFRMIPQFEEKVIERKRFNRKNNLNQEPKSSCNL